MSHPSAATRPSRLADGILVINLDHRPERLDHFAKMAEDCPWLAGWQRLPAVAGVDLPGFGRPPWFRGRARDKGWAGRAGCTLSHRKALELAKNMGWDRVLILEDDVEINASFGDRIQECLDHLDAPAADWQVCYLGSSKRTGPCRHLARLADGRGIYRIFGCSGTFAYLVRREAYDAILAQLPNEHNVWPWVSRHRAIDRWFVRNLPGSFRVWSVLPNLIGHYTSFSDVGQRAGADLALDDDDAAGHADHAPHSSNPAAFHLAFFALRLRFALARIGNFLFSPIARWRGLT